MDENKKSWGPIIGIIIILALILIGGLYFGKEQIEENRENAGDTQANDLSEQSDSDELGAIEADLNASNYDNLDQETRDIEGEFDSKQ